MFIRYHSLENDITKINTCFFDTKGWIFSNPEFHFICLIIGLFHLDNRVKSEIVKYFCCKAKKISSLRIRSDNFYLHNRYKKRKK